MNMNVHVLTDNIVVTKLRDISFILIAYIWHDMTKGFIKEVTAKTAWLLTKKVTCFAHSGQGWGVSGLAWPAAHYSMWDAAPRRGNVQLSTGVTSCICEVLTFSTTFTRQSHPIMSGSSWGKPFLRGRMLYVCPLIKSYPYSCMYDMHTVVYNALGICIYPFK